MYKKYLPYLPKWFDAYFEPFLGGGSIFFKLQPKNAFLSDANEDLINCYRMVRDNVDALISKLAEYQLLHQEMGNFWYYAARDETRYASEPFSPLVRAARLIYLNKTCYNGLYRVSQAGNFNTPAGKYDAPVICDRDGLLRASEALQGANIAVANFTHVITRAQPNDLVYCDPPYMPADDKPGFVSYTNAAFDRMQHFKLWKMASTLAYRGCNVVLSQSAVPFIEELYRRPDGYPWRLHEMTAARPINSDIAARASVREYLITQ